VKHHAPLVHLVELAESARALAQCEHPEDHMLDGTADYTARCGRCGAVFGAGGTREHPAPEPAWSRSPLVEALAADVERCEMMRRLTYPWKAGEKCRAALHIVYAAHECEVAEGTAGVVVNVVQAGLLLVRWESDPGAMRTSFESIDPAPPAGGAP
jgi:hypothetical protein